MEFSWNLWGAVLISFLSFQGGYFAAKLETGSWLVYLHGFVSGVLIFLAGADWQ